MSIQEQPPLHVGFPEDPFKHEEKKKGHFTCTCQGCGQSIDMLVFPEVPPGWFFMVRGDDVYLACKEDCVHKVGGKGWKQRLSPDILKPANLQIR